MLNIRFVLLCVILVIINGCAHHRHKDGPPDYYVDETKIPNAVPKVEPLSRIGNQPSYVVFGRRYYVMRSSKNYEERGIASWYGTQFHTHYTSNGERYNMLAMTAAHKTLPLPTYCEVTNLKNGKKIIVKINDRGPFESNRLIDLSYVAAKKLGMLGHGTTYVNVKAIDPAQYNRHDAWSAENRTPINRHMTHHREQTYVTAGCSTRGVYLQVAAFRHKANAMQLKNRIAEKLGMPVQVSHSHSLYLVKVGPFKNNAAVAGVNRKLKTIGLHGKTPSLTKNMALEDQGPRVIDGFDLS